MEELYSRIDLLEAEVERLRKLAPWHDQPRVETYDQFGVPGRLGHLISDNRRGKCFVILEGDHTPIEMESGRVYYVNGDSVCG